MENFLTKPKFSKMVEEVAFDKKISYIDAIIDICNDNSLEVEDVTKYLNNIIKDKVEAEARNLNYLPKQSTLPV